MGKTNIAWTDFTWNPIIGCSKVSPGCQNCYAEKMAWRLHMMDVVHYKGLVNTNGWTGKVNFVKSALEKPLHWKTPRKIFVCSMGDLFHESVPFEQIDKVFAIMALCPRHTFQVLTKRPERMAEYFEETMRGDMAGHIQWCARELARGQGRKIMNEAAVTAWPLPNVWLGTTAENQEMADKRIPDLLNCPAAKRFVSVEPMLDSVDITEFEEEDWKCDSCGEFYSHFQDVACNHCGYAERHAEYRNQLDHVIIGAESGPKRRYLDNEHVRDLVRQCKKAGVPVFVKQLHTQDDKMKVLKNIEDFPEDLRIREMPK